MLGKQVGQYFWSVWLYITAGGSIPRNTLRPRRYGVVSPGYGFASAYSLAPSCPPRLAVVGGPQIC
jgi:hypothetical protein